MYVECAEVCCFPLLICIAIAVSGLVSLGAGYLLQHRTTESFLDTMRLEPWLFLSLEGSGLAFWHGGGSLWTSVFCT